MDSSYDTVVIGAGPAGEVCAAQLGDAGRRVAIVESERVGGECAFWACVPSKVLLRSEEPANAARRVPGSDAALSGCASFAQASTWRDESVSNYDDTEHVPFLRDHHVTLIRGEARVDEPGIVRVGEQRIAYKTLVIATGSDPLIPDIPGLGGGKAWTPREATAAKTVPERLAILGAGPVGVELGQVFARYGSKVTLIEPGAAILSHEEPETGALMAAMLAGERVDVLTGRHARSVEFRSGGVSITVDDDRTLEADTLLIAAGRVARSGNFNAQALGLRLRKGAIAVDDRCRATDNVYAIGDVNGISPFTHVAKYQARVAGDAILGKMTRARYDAVPRCTFTDPEIASTGLTERQARERNAGCKVAKVDLTSAARASLYFDKEAPGFIKLVADSATHALVGATIMGPMASEMIGIASTAINQRTSVEDLLQTIQPF
ncbi:MAG: NAD(P)/FAD-dependent oxidoreductase, partial [Candidatus Eremiobacteraeota bacterium]|nr:NAD(P)/FAD-dependent oxidoreductase [Candidatus Eremiobacteraeota bacterium]